MTVKTKTAAKLSIKAPGKMSKQGRKDIASWLRYHAAKLMKDGDQYTDKTFNGSFNYF